MKLLGFDLQIAKEVEGSDWDSQRPFGIACAVAVLRDSEGRLADIVRPFYGGPGGNADPWPKMPREQVRHMVRWLEEAVNQRCRLCTWNGTKFDLHVLAEESGLWEDCAMLALRSIDPMLQFVQEYGFGISLGSVGAGQKLEGLTGADAPRLWKEGQYEKVIEYCTQDCILVLEAVTALSTKGELSWRSTYHPHQRVWRPAGCLLEARQVLALPSWAGDGRWGRETFMAWMPGDPYPITDDAGGWPEPEEDGHV